MNQKITSLLIVLALGFAEVHSQQNLPVQKIKQAGTLYFGMDVGLSGETLMISAGLQVYFYKRTNGKFVLESSLTPGQKAFRETDIVGGAIAISGNTAVLGAGHEDCTLVDGSIVKHAGAVYVIEKSANGWKVITRLTSDHPIENAGFGWSVSVSNGGLAVGAFGERPASDPEPGNQYGAVYIFEKQVKSGKWIQSTKLTSGMLGARFGESVKITNHGMGIFENVYRTGFPTAQKVSTFSRSEKGYQLEDSVKSTIDEFWYGQLDLFDSHLVVGGGVPNSNTADFYEKVNGKWKFLQQEKLLKEDFGDTKVAVQGNLALLSASGSGKVSVFKFGNGKWNYTTELKEDPKTQFGSSMAIENNTIVIGAYWSANCAVYVYTLNQTP